MELEKEIELLKEKLALLEKIKKLQDEIKCKEAPNIIPYIPVNPHPYIIPTIVYDPTYPVEDPLYWGSNTKDSRNSL